MTAGAVNTTSTWFTVPRNEQAKIRLFCFPYAGGTNIIFRTWGKALGPSIAVCTAHLPGRERRLTEKPYTSAQSLVEAAAEAITPHLDLPFALFGHSMGAVISFELARHLRRLNLPLPKHLFLSGRGAAQFGVMERLTYNLPVNEFAEELRRLNGTPREVLEHQELMELMIPLLRADFQVCQTYCYTEEPALDCPITAFGGLYDHEVTREMVGAWREQTSSSFRLLMMPGDHFFVNSAQERILDILAQELQRGV
jgi:medium-chain acyl-[acyl-carrier-protein] hydrolase